MVSQERKPVRRLRHWKQRYEKNARFIFRRHLKWGAKEYQPGDLIPDELIAMPAKLRRFWESRVIELADFSAPNVATGRREEELEQGREEHFDIPEGVTLQDHGNSSWYEVLVAAADGEEPVLKKINGKRAVAAFLKSIQEQRAGQEGLQNG